MDDTLKLIMGVGIGVLASGCAYCMGIGVGLLHRDWKSRKVVNRRLGI